MTRFVKGEGGRVAEFGKQTLDRMLAVLAVLEKVGEMSQTEIECETGLNPKSLRGYLAWLKDREFIECTERHDGKRAYGRRWKLKVRRFAELALAAGGRRREVVKGNYILDSLGEK